MGTPFLSEIKIVSFNFAPQGWAQCNGQLLPINQNQALFSLLGTMYGGNGQTNFALPDLRGITPLHVGGSFNVQGQKGGEQAHTISISEMPMHPHVELASPTTGATNTPTPANNFMAGATSVYRTADSLTSLIPSSITNTGGSQAHLNMQPFLTLLFCIALQGVFPSRN
ncbi:MAG TPA: tail fiber protein [Chthoniobacterales bacterium]|nr:tail fiber protein [Chthoniobacterales bacterium]